jgi:hypothetical protein
VYKERHAIANGLALANTIDYRLKPLLAHFGDRPLAEIRTADVEDFIADLRKPRIVHRRAGLGPLANASIIRTIELLRHMLNWAVGREYIDRTPFRRGTETLIRSCVRQPTTQALVGGRGATAPAGCPPAAALDDHHGPRHGHAPRRNAGPSVRRYRREATADRAPAETTKSRKKLAAGY